MTGLWQLVISLKTSLHGLKQVKSVPMYGASLLVEMRDVHVQAPMWRKLSSANLTSPMTPGQQPLLTTAPSQIPHLAWEPTQPTIPASTNSKTCFTASICHRSPAVLKLAGHTRSYQTDFSLQLSSLQVAKGKDSTQSTCVVYVNFEIRISLILQCIL